MFMIANECSTSQSRCALLMSSKNVVIIDSGVKPLTQLVLADFWLDPQKQNQVKFEKK